MFRSDPYTEAKREFDAEVSRVAADLIRKGACDPFDALRKARELVLERRSAKTLEGERNEQ